MKLHIKKPEHLSDTQFRLLLYQSLEGSPLLQYEHFIKIDHERNVELIVIKGGKRLQISDQTQLLTHKKLFPLKVKLWEDSFKKGL